MVVCVVVVDVDIVDGDGDSACPSAVVRRRFMLPKNRTTRCCIDGLTGGRDAEFGPEYVDDGEMFALRSTDAVDGR